MLTHLQINNFTLVESLEIEFNQGLTVLTGETGAGKSILLGALALTLGDKTDADKVRHGAERADIYAGFDLANLPYAQLWLNENDLAQDGECVLRRVITKEGRSRAYINGQTVPLGQLRKLGEVLIDIHSQHEHQSLLKVSTHLRLLDDYAQTHKLATQVKQEFKSWQQIHSQLENAKNQSDEQDARFQLLSYQAEELNQLELTENTVAELASEQRRLSGSDQAINSCEHARSLLTQEGSGLLENLHQTIHLVSQLEEPSERLKNIDLLLNAALVNLQEAESDLEHHIESYESDPEKLATVEAQLDQIYTVARKHKVRPEALYQLQLNIQAELDSIKPSEQLLKELEDQLLERQQNYQNFAQQLSEQRQQAAGKLADEVNNKLTLLAMAHASFHINITPAEQPTQDGNESIEFLIATQPGVEPRPLNKVASGGELSRVSLAIQVVTAQTSATPTLVFDEVDVGIGGTTGDIVGKLLREIGEQGQVLCVTHLAQVASKAHCHLRVEKSINAESATSDLIHLDKDQRIEEIARMMGGAIDSEQSLAHAKEILDTV